MFRATHVPRRKTSFRYACMCAQIRTHAYARFQALAARIDAARAELGCPAIFARTSSRSGKDALDEAKFLAAYDAACAVAESCDDVAMQVAWTRACGQVVNYAQACCAEMCISSRGCFAPTPTPAFKPRRCFGSRRESKSWRSGYGATAFMRSRIITDTL